ncbi:MAG: UDP-2,4-diacetamido-2,4,6-trideoxy-beta-L-altropyranose hydrolase, partial [Phenylobacterium sp.]
MTRVLFFADAGPVVGGGHVMRCLTLARALRAQGAECAFVEYPAAASILRRFGWPDQTQPKMAPAEDLATLTDYALRCAERFGAAVVVLDHYGAGAAEDAMLRGEGRRIVVIDDLADRAHACDLLIDPGYGRRREAYDGLADCPLLLGPDYALVRPEFAAARHRALARRARRAPVRRALVSLGLTDVGGITGRVVEALAAQLGEVRLDVVLGAGAPSLEAVSALAARDRRVRLHLDTEAMASLTADADIAVGAGGSSVWERACLGLPTACVVLADNQAPMAQGLADAGAGLVLDARAAGFDAALAEALRRLVDEPDLRWSLSGRAAELCDGRGA